MPGDSFEHCSSSAGSIQAPCPQMGCTPLHCAAALGEDEVVAELLSRGAFMDIQVRLHVHCLI